MYDPQDDVLFGHDGRHKPNPIPELLTERGWGGSRLRLAYSGMNRQDESNMSEYAISCMGTMPNGYVIVNSDTIDYDPDTAIKVGPHRVAVPVKELAKDRRLTILEQWELMHPRYIGTYFNFDYDSCRSKRPNFDDEYQKAITNGESETFMAQFWTPMYEHEAAIYRLRLRYNELEDRRMSLKLRVSHFGATVKRIRSDIAFQRHYKYQNTQLSLIRAEGELEKATREYNDLLEKMDKIERYLKQYTFR